MRRHRLDCISRIGSGEYLAPVAFFILILGTGCLQRVANTVDQTPNESPPTRWDRLIERYPELHAGRFAVLADFESSEQMELFQIRGHQGNLSTPDHRSLSTPDRRNGGRSGSDGCLVYQAKNPADTLMIGNHRAAKWYMKRDWRPYDLLLVSLRIPSSYRPGAHRSLITEVEISEGGLANATGFSFEQRLVPGWNTLRIDLADVAESIPLDNVNGIEVSLVGLTVPTEIGVDDLILTADHERFVGDPENTAGDLFAYRKGRRIHVGSGGAFEFVFRDGQFVAWYNLKTDPFRVDNLLAGECLGATVKPKFVSSFTQSVEEANRVRVRLKAHWELADASLSPEVDRHGIDAAYTIYKNGQVYTTICGLDKPSISATLIDHFGINFTPQNAKPIELTSTQSAATDSHQTTNIVQLPDDKGHLLSVALPDSDDCKSNPVRRPATSRSCYLWMSPKSRVTVDEINDHINGYLDPPPLTVHTGSTADQIDGCQLVHGFDQTSGCYILAPRDDRVSLTLDGSYRHFVSPAFTIQTEPNRKAWVYINDQLHHTLERDPQGNLIFQIPDTTTTPTRVEVLLQP